MTPRTQTPEHETAKSTNFCKKKTAAVSDTMRNQYQNKKFLRTLVALKETVSENMCHVERACIQHESIGSLSLNFYLSVFKQAEFSNCVIEYLEEFETKRETVLI